MSDKKNDINYNAEDISRYLSGKLSPLQMNAMEKAALNDPFLAEAIEGYETMPAEEWEPALAAAKRQFTEQQNNGAKIIVMQPRKSNWWKVAAAAVIISGTVITSYLVLNKKTDPPQIAKVIPATAPATQAVTVPDTIKTSIPNTPSIITERMAEEKKKASSEEDKVDAVAATNPVDTTFLYRPNPAKPAAIASTWKSGNDDKDTKFRVETKPFTTNVPAPQNGIVNSNVSPGYNYNSTANNNNALSPALSEKSAELYKKEAARKEQPLNRSFFAQVVGADNTPLPFANISIKSESFGTYADVKGNFRLVSSDSVLNVEVKSVGYQPKVYTIKSNLPQNKITLVEDDMAGREKTVVNSNVMAKSKISRRATLLKDSIVNVEPADGWDNYNTYVDNNIEIPDDILKNNIHGQVELSFDVKANGSITNIKVDKSLCDNCDEVAKRLIEQGPQWKVKKGKRGKGRVTVQF